jgi:hypothetical protein
MAILVAAPDRIQFEGALVEELAEAIGCLHAEVVFGVALWLADLGGIDVGDPDFHSI